MAIVQIKRQGKTARVFAQEYLLNAIVTLEYEPGQRLNEQELSKILEISRTPIREAILDLSECHLLDIMPQNGIFVSKVDKQFCEQVAEMRFLTEAHVISKLCEMKEPFNAGEIRDFISLQENCKDTDALRFVALDDEFHKNLFQIAGFEYGYECIRRFIPTITRLKYFSYSLKTADRALDEHKQLLSFLEAKNKENAIKLIKNHVYVALEDLKRLEEDHPDYF